MSRNFQIYRDAAAELSRGWTRGTYIDDDGGKCLVGAVLTVTDRRGLLLPASIAQELDAKLEHNWRYRILRRLTRQGSAPTQRAIEAWNDTGSCRKVVKLLNELADEQELKWLREQYALLTERVAALEAKVTTLTEHIHSLEQETRRLRRLTNSFALRADRQQLAKLEDELSVKWEELSIVSAQLG